MAFFRFSQNNSGGVWCGPAMEVYVEAPSAKVANALALDYDIYFDGCDSGMDCSCCGDRWYPAWEEGVESPKLPEPDAMYDRWAEGAKIPRTVVFYLDGRVEKF